VICLKASAIKYLLFSDFQTQNQELEIKNSSYFKRKKSTGLTKHLYSSTFLFRQTGELPE
jgi:hypothetical protein